MRLNKLRNFSKYLPQWMKKGISKFVKLLVYRNYDSSAYWRMRAAEPGQAAVLWKNQEYNKLYRDDQKKIIAEFLSKIPADGKVLDIGCGIGVVAKMVVDLHSQITVDAVDFEEMINIARDANSHPRVNYIASPAEEYCLENKTYDLIISSGCYSAIRNISSLEAALDKTEKLCKDDGIILMIDPFHKWNYLARAKYNTKDVARRMKIHGFSLIKKSGILFWPYREILANSELKGVELSNKYRQGEKLLSIFGSHFWADYKILAFKK